MSRSAVEAVLQGHEPWPALAVEADSGAWGGIAVPLRLATPVGPLSLLSTTTVFGTPRDVTLAELAVEAFYPADEATAERLRRLAAESPQADVERQPWLNSAY